MHAIQILHPIWHVSIAHWQPAPPVMPCAPFAIPFRFRDSAAILRHY